MTKSEWTINGPYNYLSTHVLRNNCVKIYVVCDIKIFFLYDKFLYITLFFT